MIQELTVHLETQLKLCTALEKIADDLPDKVCRQSCLHAARSIYPIIKSAHQFEEERLFPALQSALEARPASAGNPIQRLMEEHWEDESFGQEIADVMREFVAGRDANTDKLGYMLRGFFDGLRRHIAFERELLGPLLGVMES
ncbi:MAG: hemerythrin domain-containing protein [Pseudomonadota bacterium]